MIKLGLVVHRRVVERVRVHLVHNCVVLYKQVVVGILLFGLLLGGPFVLLNLPLHLVHDLEALVDLGRVPFSIHSCDLAKLTRSLGSKHLSDLRVVLLLRLPAVVVGQCLLVKAQVLMVERGLVRMVLLGAEAVALKLVVAVATVVVGAP